ncbi:SDR family NAD(P)-dependent oxidoreductase [Actinoplanes friuliensis]|uniref:Probable oxidoreductase n=1 Tax=Actinoplanes friuliensis DSM 7358 TaxID=1246995 RepID=U5WB38_9ACTN|nr:SDR family NAD(P)-dependent oxidoreductase [Actinoplanes friuliensis]AGZ45151.1 short-chain dehydrogenase/reductase SDR [Actinoplanes friuliensis DSM 7358]
MTPFGATSTAAEVIAGADLTGRHMIVTGGASGIGLETARALTGAGATVTLAVRDVGTGEKVAADLGGDIRVAHLDLADHASITTFVAGWDGPLHALINNAGIMATPLLRTPEGWELQFATNHLGHFALTLGLHDALAAGNARIVSVSSVGHITADINFTDVNFSRREYDPWVAYGQSKTANILFAVEAARRWAGDGITANALNPGRIVGTGLTRHIGDVVPADPHVSWKNAAQGAATSVLLAASPLTADVTGRYYEDCAEAVPHVPGVRRGVAAYAMDPDRAARLWDLSLGLLGR